MTSSTPTYVKEAAEAICDAIFPENDPYHEDHLDMVIQRILKHLSKPSEWVAVRDRLPDEATPVLVSRIYTSPEVSRDELPHVDCWYRNGGFTYKVVTHWMPLPLPPAPKEKV